MSLLSNLQRVKEWDDQRPSLPGEHWFALGLGLLVTSRAQRSRSIVGRLAGNAVAVALMARAASGKDGVIGKMAGAARRL